MKKLFISNHLSLPLDMATSTAAIIAIRGAGKSYTAAVIAEEMIGNGVQTVIIDPTGAWWGLRSSSDGKSAGLPVIVMGGNHGDVPLEESAGEVVAEFIVESRASVILDLSLMRKNAQKRFMADFAEHLYHLKAKTENQTPLHVILDEGDRFAPQKPQPEHARLLGAIEDIVRLGRSRGFGFTVITQRAAVLNKDVLTQIETLIILRTTSPQDRKAMMEWVRENSTEEEFEKVASSLSSLPNGTAWVWSPSFLKVLKKVEIRTRRTFNSSATPKVGEKRIEPKVIAPVDLDTLKGRIAESIQRVKSKDPKELIRRVAELERQLQQRPAAAPAPVPTVVTVSLLKDAHVKSLGEIVKEIREAVSKGIEAADEIAKAVASAQSLSDVSNFNVSVSHERIGRIVSVDRHSHKTPPLSDGDKTLRTGEKRILEIVVSNYPNAISKIQVATLTGIKPRGSTFVTYIGVLRRLGLIDDRGDSYLATQAGRNKAGTVQKFPTGRLEVLRLWTPKLRTGEKIMLEGLVGVMDQDRGEGSLGQTKETVAAWANIDPNGSTFSTYLGVLRRNGLVVVDRSSGEIRANEEVFA